MNKILIHVRNNDSIKQYIEFFKDDNHGELYDECSNMIDTFIKNNWKVYITTLDNIDIDKKLWKNVYCINERKAYNFNIENINEIDTIIFRSVGSVEGKFDLIQKYLQMLISNYHGLVLNNPRAILKGMTKRYLTEIDKDELNDIGIETIDTDIYDSTVSLDELLKKYDNPENYIIKPSSGELSNSINNLSVITEDILRYKETKVKGWVVQPIKKEIWNGEYQMSFLNHEMIYSQKKVYADKNNNIPIQNSRTIEKYTPSVEEIETMKKLIDYMEKLYGVDIYICRVDFMKNEQNKPILLEFEMVNPGFFIAYLKSDDDSIKKICDSIYEYCVNNIAHKKALIRR